MFRIAEDADRCIRVLAYSLPSTFAATKVAEIVHTFRVVFGLALNEGVGCTQERLPLVIDVKEYAQ